MRHTGPKRCTACGGHVWKGEYTVEANLDPDPDAPALLYRHKAAWRCRLAKERTQSMRRHLLAAPAQVMATAEQVARAYAALEQCVQALADVEPQVRGVLVVQDVTQALARGRAVLSLVPQKQCKMCGRPSGKINDLCGECHVDAVLERMREEEARKLRRRSLVGTWRAGVLYDRSNFLGVLPEGQDLFICATDDPTNPYVLSEGGRFWYVGSESELKAQMSWFPGVVLDGSVTARLSIHYTLWDAARVAALEHEVRAAANVASPPAAEE